jgi:threonine dehydrogenase-like Zn-dependent dehydrogenase
VFLCVLQISKAIPAWQAAYIEPLACSVHAVELGDIQLPEVVVVSGCGPLGLGMVATAKLKNPRKLIALDLLDWKVRQSEGLERASSFSKTSR